MCCRIDPGVWLAETRMKADMMRLSRVLFDFMFYQSSLCCAGRRVDVVFIFAFVEKLVGVTSIITITTSFAVSRAWSNHVLHQYKIAGNMLEQRGIINWSRGISKTLDRSMSIK